MKIHNLVKKSHKTANFCYIMSQTYGINSTTKQKLVNLNYWMNKFVINITKKNYLHQDAGDRLWPNHYHCVEIHRSTVQFGYILREIGNRNRRSQWTSEQNVTIPSVLTPGFVDLQKFMFSADTTWQSPR